MNTFWVVTAFHLLPTKAELEKIESLAFQEHQALGIEEFSLSESEVDEILGTRSYSGGDLPFEVIEEVEEKVFEKPGNYRFFFAVKEDAFGFEGALKKDCLCEIQTEEFPQADWNAEWKKHYEPIRVNELLEIIPSWEKEYASTSQKQIYIYPGMGFGTGSHETTFLCLKLFTENVLSKNCKTILDFGSGSGILGLASLLFFQDAQVDFFDIDLEANKNCYQNAELNKLTEKSFRLLLPEFRDLLLPTYDLVFANILESILYLEQGSLIAHTTRNGYLILSGLLRPQVEGIIESYSMAGVNLISRVEKGDWAALLFQKGDK